MQYKLQGDDEVIVYAAMEYLTAKPADLLDEASQETLLTIGGYLMHPSPETKAAAVEAADQYFRSFVDDQDTPRFGMQPICSACLGTGYVEDWHEESTRCHWCNGTGFAAAGGGGGTDDDELITVIEVIDGEDIYAHDSLDTALGTIENLLVGWEEFDDGIGLKLRVTYMTIGEWNKLAEGEVS